MHEEHGLTLLQQEMQEIVNIVKDMLPCAHPPKTEAVSQRWPLRIHKSQLPKKITTDADREGFIYGYLIFNERDYKAAFMNDTLVFECSRPVILVQTHLLVRYSTVVYTGYDKYQKQVGEVCELTFFFNNK